MIRGKPNTSVPPPENTEQNKHMKGTALGMVGKPAKLLFSTPVAMFPIDYKSNSKVWWEAGKHYY